MLWRFRDLFGGGQDLLRAEAQLAVRKVRRSLVAAGLLAFAAGVALIGLLILLAGVGIVLARELGWVASLGVIGGGLLFVGLGAVFIIAERLRDLGEPASGPGPKEKARQSKEQMSDAVDPSVSKEEAHPEASGPGAGARSPDDGDGRSLEDLAAAAIDFAARNPMAVAGGAFAVASLIGPGRAVRMVSRGLTVASIAASVLGKMVEDDDAPPASPTPAGSGSGAARTARAAAGANGSGPERAPRTDPTPSGSAPGTGKQAAGRAGPTRATVPTRDAPPERFRVTGP